MFKEVYITELPDKFPSTCHRNLCIIEESALGIVAAALAVPLAVWSDSGTAESPTVRLSEL